MAKHHYHDHLRQVPLFAGLTEHELDEVGRAATELSFPPGEVLLRQGSVAHEMFVVVSGTLDVTRDGEHVAEIGPGGIAGEMALLTHAHRNSTVTAKTDVELIHIDGRSFSALLEDIPQVAVKMLPIVATRVSENSSHHDH